MSDLGSGFAVAIYRRLSTVTNRRGDPAWQIVVANRPGNRCRRMLPLPAATIRRVLGAAVPVAAVKQTGRLERLWHSSCDRLASRGVDRASEAVEAASNTTVTEG